MKKKLITAALGLLFFAAANGFSQETALVSDKGTAPIAPPDKGTAPIASPDQGTADLESPDKYGAYIAPTEQDDESLAAAEQDDAPSSTPAQASPSAQAQKTPSTPVKGETPPPVVSEQDTNKNVWKNKRWYLGGYIGGGRSHTWVDTYYVNNYYGGYYRAAHYDSNGVFAIGVQVELSIFSWLALEFDLGSAPIVSGLAKIGGRPGPMEMFFNIGVSNEGFTLGGTLGFHVGPGVLFTELLYGWKSESNIFVGVLGYKVGLVTKK